MRTLFCIVALFVFGACELVNETDETPTLLDVPEGFTPVPVPAGSPITSARVALGERLFFDPRLSVDGTVSCASCHVPEAAFSDARRVSLGVHGREGFRNSPSLVNVAYNRLFFRDGGALTLESQALAPLENEDEMGMNLGELVERLNEDETYASAFSEAFAAPPEIGNVTLALAAFQRTIRSGGSRFDRYRAGERSALAPSEERGLQLFEGAAGCSGCHQGFLLGSQEFQNNGLAFAAPDSGRARITLNTDDFGKFRVPSLRNVALTAPYMHDGSLQTLDEVIDHYDKGGTDVRGKSERIKPLGLTESEKVDLKAFLLSLSDSVIKTGIRE